MLLRTRVSIALSGVLPISAEIEVWQSAGMKAKVKKQTLALLIINVAFLLYTLASKGNNVLTMVCYTMVRTLFHFEANVYSKNATFIINNASVWFLTFAYIPALCHTSISAEIGRTPDSAMETRVLSSIQPSTPFNLHAAGSASCQKNMMYRRGTPTGRFS